MVRREHRRLQIGAAINKTVEGDEVVGGKMLQQRSGKAAV
jgi:hypothetical protein